MNMKQSPRGMSLLELLLAMSVTVLTGAAATTLGIAVSRSMTSITAGRSATQRAHLVQARLRSVSDTSLCFLDADPKKGVALWTGDENGDGRVNLLELRVAWIDSDAGTISDEYVVFPESWTPEQVVSNNLTLAAADDPFAAMLAQRALGRTTTLAVGQKLTVSALEPNAPSIRGATRLRLAGEIIDDQGNPVQLLTCLGLPSHRVPQ